MRTLCLIAALSMLTAAPALAHADTAPARTVSAAGLDLSQAQGQAAMKRRIDAAVVAVCGEVPSGSRLVPAPIARCRARAQAGAQEQLALLAAASQAKLAAR